MKLNHRFLVLSTIDKLQPSTIVSLNLSSDLTKLLQSPYKYPVIYILSFIILKNMRRIKVSGIRAYYHAMTRTVNGEVLLDPKAKEILRKSLWKSAAFCEVRLLNYCIMDNHFHVLLGIDPVPALNDDQLIAKVTAFYSHPGERQRRDEIIKALRSTGERSARMRRLLMARMGDLSAYMKTVKQRFSRWFNRQQSRFGTLYADRFRSVLLEGGSGHSLLTVAAYIALNPIRAGLTTCPESYRYSGYAEAMAGKKEALTGLRELTGQIQGPEALKIFRQVLYGKGGMPKADGSGGEVIETKSVVEVLRKGGAVHSFEALRCRLRFLTDGLILGREEFVAETLQRLHNNGLRMARRRRPVPVNGSPEWGNLAVMRQLRGKIYG